LKINNETKVGALAAVAITILVLGYNFLSGRDSLWSNGKTYYVKFYDLKGLTKANPVIYKGYRIGQVSKLKWDKNEQSFVAELDIQKDIIISEGSIATIADNDLFGTKAILITLGESKTEAKDNTFLKGEIKVGMAESIGNSLGPISEHLDSLISNLNATLSGSALKGTLANLEATTSNLKGTSLKIDQILLDNQVKLNAIFANVESITGNLKNNNAIITNVIKNADSFSNQLKALEINKTINAANMALNEFNTLLQNVNNGNGSLSLLLKDPKLYNNLEKVSKDLDALIIDINKYPKRYFSIGSGKKADKARDADLKNGTYNITTPEPQ